MRILIATWHRTVVGGTEKYLKMVLPALRQLGHEVSLIHEEPVQLEREVIDACDPIPATWCLGEVALAPLMRSVAEWKPDLVFSQGLHSGDLENALLDNYPVALFAHNYYGTCATGTKCHAFPTVQPCNRRFGPACLVLNYPRRCGGWSPWSLWQLYQRQAQRLARLPDYRAILVASEHMYTEFLRHGVGRDRLHLVPHPVASAVQARAPLEPKAPRGQILFIGRLTALKGGHYLIQAISQAASRLNFPLTLTVAGDGPERQNLQALAGKLRVGAEFVGWVSSERVIELLRDADVLAVPSLWPEPFGLVGIEAARQGVPAVGYAVGGISDWLISGRTGELAAGDPPTVEGLADAIVRIFSDAEHYGFLRKEAWESSAKFTLTSHLAHLEQALTSEHANSWCGEKAPIT